MEAKMQKKVTKIEAFINETLKGDLGIYQTKLDSKLSDVAEFNQLKTIINTLKNINAEKEGFKTKLDLGENIFVQAHVQDASCILLDVGLGHFVELPLDHALKIVDVRIKLLDRQIDNMRKQIAKTQAHIKYCLLTLHELQGLKTPTPERRNIEL